MKEQLRMLIERHCENIRGNVETVGQNLARICGSSAGKIEALIEAENLTHQIKGSSGSIGFPQVSAAAAALDDHLKHLCGAGGTLTTSDRDRLFGLYEELRRITAAISPETSTLYPMTVSPALSMESKARQG